MGAFDRTICDCCVCPMQCVMQKLVTRDVGIATAVSVTPVTINSVENFIANTSQGSFPICNVTAVGSIPPFDIDLNLKPVQKDIKGKCSCCEDPATNELQQLIGKEVDLEFIGGIAPFADGNIVTGKVSQVGEGILILSDLGITFSNAAISTCQITRIELN
ncbi:hypothetical protein [Chengkuizengella sediminis]|uniref:hypothetical protein n=1 Tax=Chengkuizengella sediminis TaxID=1885917 RepID=UPI001389C8AB|nr:hypothetical protein [Chengkuizengella sediminis]NDI33439.1 hypothetical protein [Chengkuizengella sediminis]